MPKLKPEQLTPMGPKILVRKYTRPEKVGSILLNPAWREDHSRALWEVVKASEEAKAFLAERFAETEVNEDGEIVTKPLEVKPDYILVTAKNRGVHCSAIELPKREGGTRPEAFFVHAAEVAQVKAWDGEDFEEGEDDDIA